MCIYCIYIYNTFLYLSTCVSVVNKMVLRIGTCWEYHLFVSRYIFSICFVEVNVAKAFARLWSINSYGMGTIPQQFSHSYMEVSRANFWGYTLNHPLWIVHHKKSMGDHPFMDTHKPLLTRYEPDIIQIFTIMNHH